MIVRLLKSLWFSKRGRKGAFDAGFRAALKLCPPRLVPAGPPRVWYCEGKRGRIRNVDIGPLVIKDPTSEIEVAWKSYDGGS